MSPASGDYEFYSLSKGMLSRVSIQLMSPASGDFRKYIAGDSSAKNWHQVSIQLMSPASGD